MLTRPVIKEANLFNMSMLALLAAINKKRTPRVLRVLFQRPGLFSLGLYFYWFWLFGNSTVLFSPISINTLNY